MNSKFTITRIVGGPFSLLWIAGPNATQNLATILGFTNDNTAVTVAISNNPASLLGENYIFLCIDDFRTNIPLYNNSDISDVFAKIIWNENPYAVSNTINDHNITANDMYFSEPLNNLNHLHVTFRQQDGTLYNFNGQEHSFSIEFIVNP